MRQDADERRSQILAAIGRAKTGISIAQIHATIKTDVERRTLQRDIDKLIEAGVVTPQGQARARIYHLTSKQPSPAHPSKSNPPLIALTQSSKKTLTAICQPIQRRLPVSYKSSFLEAYQPNETSYLSKKNRTKLFEWGGAPDPSRPAGTYARDILNRLLIDLAWASSKLEGNTYSHLDTKNLIEFGQEAQDKDRTEAQMILNHKQAVEFLVENAADIKFNPHTILNLHALLSDNLLANDKESGRVRQRSVDITGTSFIPLSIPQKIQDNFEQALIKAEAIRDPFEQAFFVMVQLPYLQPFIDVNKRVSRIAANIPLIKGNLCPLSFVDIPEETYIQGTLAVYELQQVDLLRDVFIWAYERSCQRYAVIQETTIEPDPIRMRHRELFTAVVGDIVREQKLPTIAAVRKAATGLVPESDLNRFTELALSDLENLHPGNVSRFRLRLSEYKAWAPIQGRAKTPAS